MKNLIHPQIKFIIFSLCLVAVSCQKNSEFEEKLVEDNGAWNTFIVNKNDNIIDYQDLIVFKKDKSWIPYMRSSPRSKMILKPLNIDEKKNISKWSFNKKDSIFILNEEMKYRLRKLENDTIFLEPIFNKKNMVILVKDSQVYIPERW